MAATSSSSSSVHPPPPQLSLPSQPPPLPSSSAPLPFVSRAELPHYRLYDFTKTALIKIFVSPYATVCDLYCGGGSDTDKWDEAQIGHYIGVGALLPCYLCSSSPYFTVAWLQMRRRPASAMPEKHGKVKGNPTRQNSWTWTPLSRTWSCIWKTRAFQSTSSAVCNICRRLCFDSEERARNLLRNVANLLKPGGYFFGITPDSSTIWTKYQKNVEASHSKASSMKPVVPNCIRSENYVITFETEEEKFPLFGKRYHLKFANDITSESHCLVHFPSLIRLAREAGLEYVEIHNLTEFYDDNRLQLAGMLFNFGANFVDPRGKLLPRAFDILGLYTTFVFQKPDPNVTAGQEPGSAAAEEQEWSTGGWRQQAGGQPEEERNGPSAEGGPECGRGILGPGPSDLRFSEPPPF